MAPSAGTTGDAGVDREQDAAGCARTARRLSALVSEIDDEFAQHDVERRSVPARNRGWWYRMNHAPGSDVSRLERFPVTNPDSWEPPAPAVADARAAVVLDFARDRPTPGAQLGTRSVSPDGRHLAWSYDPTGDERFTVVVRALTPGAGEDRVLTTAAGPNVAWSPDSTAVHTTELDPRWRPYRIHRHDLTALGAPPAVVLSEDDPLVSLRVTLSRSGAHVVAHAVGPGGTEVSLLGPGGPQVLVPRSLRRRCAVDHVRRTGNRGEFVALHDGARAGFSVAVVPPPGDSGPWTELVDLDDDVRLTQVLAFAGFDVLSGMIGGTPGHLVRLNGTSTPRPVTAPGVELPLVLGHNDDQDCPSVRYLATSFSRPPTTLDHRPAEDSWPPRNPEGHPGPELDHETRWVTAADGTAVPMTVLRPHGAPVPGPVVLHVYGSYGVSLQPTFDPARLPYLRRGVTVALAHVRGGGERGPTWHAAGRARNKAVAVTDYLACARELVRSGTAAPGKILATGASAGGTIVAAALNQHPTVFTGALLEAPFVDPLGSISDPDQPFAARDRAEWGDPDDPADLTALHALSPLQNVRPGAYPPVWCTAARNDVRVPLQGPADWVHAVRAASTSTALIHLEVLDAAGHRALAARTPSTAVRTAWALDVLGAHHPPVPTTKEPT